MARSPREAPGRWSCSSWYSSRCPGGCSSDQLDYLALSGDDFAYVADARDGPRMLSNLFKPHNTHIVPLFRLWTFALVRGLGSAFAASRGPVLGILLHFRDRPVAGRTPGPPGHASPGGRAGRDGDSGAFHGDGTHDRLVLGGPGPVRGQRDRGDPHRAGGLAVRGEGSGGWGSRPSVELRRR